MSFWTNLQQSLIELIDDRQDFWQWTALILCFIAAISASFLLRQKAFCHGSQCHAIITRFFNPGKEISFVPASFCILLWITWAARNQWSNQLSTQGHNSIPSNYIFTAALLVSASGHLSSRHSGIQRTLRAKVSGRVNAGHFRPPALWLA